MAETIAEPKSTESKLCRIAVEASLGVARIVLRNPPLNVIDIAMMEELAHVLAEIQTRTDVSVVMLSGAGKEFSAGVDVAAHAPDKVREMLAKFHGVVRALVGSRKVTIAVVHGHCLGGGAELAMICDLVYTTDSARWGFPEINLGCYPPVACALLGSIVGQRRGAEMILTGRTIDGGEAAKIGLATAAVAESELGPAVEECVKRLRKLSPSALALAKKASSSWDSMNFDRNLARAEQIYLEELIHTADAHEGIRAFVEKREPKWIGK